MCEYVGETKARELKDNAIHIESLLTLGGSKLRVSYYDKERGVLGIDSDVSSSGELKNISLSIFNLCKTYITGELGSLLNYLSSVELTIEDITYNITPNDFNALDFYMVHIQYLSLKAMKVKEGTHFNLTHNLNKLGYTISGIKDDKHTYTYTVTDEQTSHLNITKTNK